MSNTLVSDLLGLVLGEGSFDATEEQALTWLDRKHQLMCARTRCFRKRIELGPTVAGVAVYPIPPEVLEIREIEVGSPSLPEGVGIPYGAARTIDVAEGQLGYIWLGGLYLRAGGGIYAKDYSVGGADLLSLFPTPTEAGLFVKARAVCRPKPLAVAEELEETGGHIKIVKKVNPEQQTVVTPPELDDALVAGAIATGLERLEARPDLAASFSAQFDNGCSELLAEVNRRVRGSGPVQIRIQGVNA